MAKIKMSFGRETFKDRVDVYQTVQDMIRGYSGNNLATLQRNIIEYVGEQLGKEIDRVTAYRWITSNRKPDDLILPIDWHNEKVLREVSDPVNQARIRRSVNYFDRFIVNHDIYFFPENFRYVKWANFVLNNMGDVVALDIDLWTIAKAYENRDTVGLDTDDLDAWIDYAPYLSGDNEKRYLTAIEENRIKPLNNRQEAFRDYLDSDPQELNNKYPSIARSSLARVFLGIYDYLNKYPKKLPPYYLPSQQIQKYKVQYFKDQKIALGSPSYVVVDTSADNIL